MADEEGLSKRERQKARRQERLKEQQVAAARARRSRLTILTVIALIIAAGTGYLVFDRAAQREAVAALTDEMGCTPVEAQPDLGEGHFTSAEQLEASPPQELYTDGLGTSGMHLPPGQWARTGVYDKQVDQRVVVHNLEHGYVAVWYDGDADPEQVEALKDWGRRQIDRGRQELIVAEIHEQLPGEANFAAVTWGQRQLCEGFAPEVAQAFLDRFHNNAASPEALAGPHVQPGDGLDPDEVDGPLLYPPIGDFGAEAGEPGVTESPSPAATETPTQQ